MKEIIAIIRPNKWPRTKAALLEEGFNAFTVHRVYGRGRQKGLQYLSKSRQVVEGICFLPKRMVTLFVPDEEAEKAVAVLSESNKTGEIGDGKIFVCPLETVQRVRTGEKGTEVLA